MGGRADMPCICLIVTPIPLASVIQTGSGEELLLISVACGFHF